MGLQCTARARLLRAPWIFACTVPLYARALLYRGRLMLFQDWLKSRPPLLPSASNSPTDRLRLVNGLTGEVGRRQRRDRNPRAASRAPHEAQLAACTRSIEVGFIDLTCSGDEHERVSLRAIEKSQRREPRVRPVANDIL